jgi:VIT1/CCC1 family predicted Fe2+/Mn2+ transporter
MVKKVKNKKNIFMNIIKDVLDYIPKTILASIFPSIVEGTEMVMDNIEGKIMRIEKRIMRKISSFLIIRVGGLFLIFALFFFLKEYLGWSNATAFFYIGITVFVIGIILKLGESDRKK